MALMKIEKWPYCWLTSWYIMVVRAPCGGNCLWAECTKVPCQFKVHTKALHTQKKTMCTSSACRPCIACSRIEDLWHLAGYYQRLVVARCSWKLRSFMPFKGGGLKSLGKWILGKSQKLHWQLLRNCCWWAVGSWREATGWQHQLGINTGSALGVNPPNNQPDFWSPPDFDQS